jgi:hypothetical protein
MWNGSSVVCLSLLPKKFAPTCSTGQFGYQPGDVVCLTDDSSDPRLVPTRQNMIQAMQWLVQGAQPNDALFFHCPFFSGPRFQFYVYLLFSIDSGHGGQTADLDGDETDGFDEGMEFFEL